MLGILLTFVFFALLCIVSVLLIRFLGHVAGAVLGAAGFVFLSVFAVVLFEFSFLALPLLLVAGAVVIGIALAKN